MGHLLECILTSGTSYHPNSVNHLITLQRKASSLVVCVTQRSYFIFIFVHRHDSHSAVLYIRKSF